MKRQISDLKVIWLCSQVSPIDVSTDVNYQILSSAWTTKSSDKKNPSGVVERFSSLFNLCSSIFQCRQQSQCLRNPLTPQRREEKRWHYPAGPLALLSPPSPGTGRLCTHIPLASVYNQVHGKILVTLSFLSGRIAKHRFWILFKKLLYFCFQICWLN